MHPRPELVPPAARVLAWIEAVVGEGIRRPGSPADRRVEDWAAEELRRLGVDDVRLEPLDVPVWDFASAALTAWPRERPAAATTFAGFALPHTRATDGLEADIVPLDEATTGHIALDHLELNRLPQSLLRGLATAVHDPEREFDSLVQVLPFGTRFQLVAEPAIAAGAGAYVGVLSGLPWDTCDYYVPYDGIERPIPALWLDRPSGVELGVLLEHGPVRGRVVVDACRSLGRSHNVIGTLPGPSDEWVVIASHHDAPWASAVEDGSGIALVLAQAQYWAQVPRADRPHNLLFLLTAGHMVHGAGTRAFIEAHRDLLERVVLEVHLEHAATECRGEDGRLVATGQPEVRWWFTTRDADLERTVTDAVVTEDLRRSFVLPPDVFFEHPPTDGGFFHLEGVPLVNFLTAPMYLFDSADTIDKVHVPSLEPVTRAVVRIVAAQRNRTRSRVADAEVR